MFIPCMVEKHFSCIHRLQTELLRFYFSGKRQTRSTYMEVQSVRCRPTFCCPFGKVEQSPEPQFTLGDRPRPVPVKGLACPRQSLTDLWSVLYLLPERSAPYQCVRGRLTTSSHGSMRGTFLPFARHIECSCQRNCAVRLG